jgi:hypothetical protein
MGDAYKSIVDQMGALYAEMQKMMEEMTAADESELSDGKAGRREEGKV